MKYLLLAAVFACEEEYVDSVEAATADVPSESAYGVSPPEAPIVEEPIVENAEAEIPEVPEVPEKSAYGAPAPIEDPIVEDATADLPEEESAYGSDPISSIPDDIPVVEGAEGEFPEEMPIESTVPDIEEPILDDSVIPPIGDAPEESAYGSPPVVEDVEVEIPEITEEPEPEPECEPEAEPECEPESEIITDSGIPADSEIPIDSVTPITDEANAEMSEIPIEDYMASSSIAVMSVTVVGALLFQ